MVKYPASTPIGILWHSLSNYGRSVKTDVQPSGLRLGTAILEHAII